MNPLLDSTRDILKLLPSYTPNYKTFLNELNNNLNLHDRTHFPAHLTTSTLVIDPLLKTSLLVDHPKIKLWTQLGGHIESTDLSILQSATREAREESGIDNLVLDPFPFSLDILTDTPCSSGNLATHFNITFLAKVDSRKTTLPNNFSTWWSIFSLPNRSDKILQDLVNKVKPTL